METTDHTAEWKISLQY